MSQLAGLLRSRRDDRRPALTAAGQTRTFAELWHEIEETAKCLARHGVRAGSRLVLALPNSPALVATLFAADALDAVAVPLDPALGDEERARIFAIAQPHNIVSTSGEHPVAQGAWLTTTAVAPPRDTDAELRGVAIIIFTSGTTGAPKGVMLGGDALLTNAQSVVRYLGLNAHDRTLVFLPLFYSYPLSQVLTTWMVGGTVVLLQDLRFPVLAVRAIDEYEVTGLAGVPSSLRLIAGVAPRARRSPRYVMNAGGPLAPALAAKLQDAFPGAELYNNYGCTEIGPRATAINYREHPDRGNSIGRAIDQVTVRLIRDDLTEAAPHETGEIVLSGPTLMKGYYRDPAGTRSKMSAWGFHTGDYAHTDADGFLYFEGRRDDIFKCGGEKISAREIEDVLVAHAAVVEAAVVAEPDDTWGQVPVAYVVSSSNAAVTPEALQRFCRESLALRKVPRRIEFVPRLERTSNGKVRKFALKGAGA